jgi:hypothetical protein
MTYEENVAYALRQDNKTPHDLQLIEIYEMTDEEQYKHIYDYVSGPDMESWDWDLFPDKFREDKELFKIYLNNKDVSYRYGALRKVGKNIQNDREIADIVVSNGG